MVTYLYKCNACSNEHEARQRMTAEPLTTCPRCGRDQLRRVIFEPAAIIYRSAGFYSTDNKGRNQ